MAKILNRAYIKRLTEWRRKRIKNYATKKAISFTEAIEKLLEFSTSKQVIAELDKACDFEFHSSKKPEISYQ